ncbi:hypothetical protein KQI61_07920 [Anaerocolumna aminovalerica]|uniref:hypothetical protein n=1 Tax=Anaerocolumna aminovalerica TaxID=1527 RepID=UPI001C0E9F1D|nr:hypothetical protein [Anaerocolumna aminovalerica]MBU5332123.1 hypothetical protein [Anaerocolumna aminovalerica]
MANNIYPVDISGNIEQWDVYLRRRNLSTIGCLHPIESLKIKKNLNAFSEISFSISKNINGRINPYWDKVVDLSIVFVQQHGNFEVTVSTTTDGITEKKNISGKSLEVELDHIKLFDFQVNTDDIQDEDYSPIVFYNPIDVEHSLLHLAIKKAPSWSILHVDDELWSKQRSFDVNDVSIYSFITNDIATELKCIFIFDSFNRTISCFKAETYGYDTNVFIDCENYAKEITLEAPADQIFNWFKVYGGDNVIDIREVNPNGTDYVTFLGDNDKKDMSPKLVNKLENYNVLYDSKQSEFITIMQNLQAQVDIIWDLNNKYPEILPIDGDYSGYGLVYLESILDGVQSLEDSYLALGYGSTKDSHYSLYSSNHNKLLLVQAEIRKRKDEIKVQEDIASQIRSQINAIQQLLNLENYLGTDLYLELSNYKRESTYKNENYTVTEYTTDSERISMEMELMNRAMDDLKIACNPQPTLTSTISNLMARPEFQNMALNDFQLGNFIHVGVNEDYVAKIRLISIEYDFDNIADIVVEFSDMTKSGNIVTDFKSIIEQAQSAASSYEIVERQMNNASDQLGFVAKMRNEGLNTAHTAITSANNIGISFDNHGFLARKWNEEKLDWEDQQLKIINNLIAFTNDYWRSVQAALGYINVNGRMVYGLIVDAFVGKWVFTENAFIGNDENTMTFDRDGFRAYSSDFLTMLSINPNKKDGLFEIWNNFKKPNAERTVWIDSGGNAWFKGNITASSITSSKFTCTNGKNTVIIDPNDEDSIFTILKGSDKQIYFDVNGNAVFNGRMTVGAIYSQNWLTSGGSADGTIKGKEGTYLNLTNGTFRFANERLVLDDEGLTTSSTYEGNWMGLGQLKYKADIELKKGYLRLLNNSNGRDLFFIPEGISTNKDGQNATGTISFFSNMYGSSGNPLYGITIQTDNSPVALRSLRGSVLIHPKAATLSNSTFMFNCVDSNGDGLITYGDYKSNDYSVSLRLSSNKSDPTVWITDSSNGTATGNLVANELRSKVLKIATDKVIYENDVFTVNANTFKARNIAISGTGTLGGSKIATKTDLDLLMDAYETSLKQWETAYNTKVQQLNAANNEIDRLNAKIATMYTSCSSCCPSCPSCPDCPD